MAAQEEIQPKSDLGLNLLNLLNLLLAIIFKIVIMVVGKDINTMTLYLKIVPISAYLQHIVNNDNSIESCARRGF